MDFINGFFMIMSAVAGALITLMGQFYKERRTRPKLKSRMCANPSEKGDKLDLYLVVENEGQRSTNEIRAYIRRSCESGKITRYPTVIDLPNINPKGSLIYDIGYAELKTSRVMFYEQGCCDEGDASILHVTLSSYDSESIFETYTLSEEFLKSLEGLPEGGIEVVWIRDAEMKKELLS